MLSPPPRHGPRPPPRIVFWYRSAGPAGAVVVISVAAGRRAAGALKMLLQKPPRSRWRPGCPRRPSSETEMKFFLLFCPDYRIEIMAGISTRCTLGTLKFTLNTRETVQLEPAADVDAVRLTFVNTDDGQHRAPPEQYVLLLTHSSSQSESRQPSNGAFLLYPEKTYHLVHDGAPVLRVSPVSKEVVHFQFSNASLGKLNSSVKDCNNVRAMERRVMEALGVV